MCMESFGQGICCSDAELIYELKRRGYNDVEIEFIIRDDDTDEDRGDSTYKGSYRNVFYPSGFANGIWKAIYDRDIGQDCPICYEQLRPGQSFEVDHIRTVVEHFNFDKGYTMSQAERREWYNTTENLQLTHKKCNRSKSGNGHHFEQSKVQYAIQHFC